MSNERRLGIVVDRGNDATNALADPLWRAVRATRKLGAMTREDVVNNGLVSRYVRGELDVHELPAFEAHCIECEETRLEVEIERRLVAALSERTSGPESQSVREHHDLHSPPYLSGGVRAWPSIAMLVGFVSVAPLAIWFIGDAPAPTAEVHYLPTLRSPVDWAQVVRVAEGTDVVLEFDAVDGYSNYHARLVRLSADGASEASVAAGRLIASDGTLRWQLGAQVLSVARYRVRIQGMPLVEGVLGEPELLAEIAFQVELR